MAARDYLNCIERSTAVHQRVGVRLTEVGVHWPSIKSRTGAISLSLTEFSCKVRDSRTKNIHYLTVRDRKNELHCTMHTQAQLRLKPERVVDGGGVVLSS